MSGGYFSAGGTGGGEKPQQPLNSLLNAFVPDDLVTFSAIPSIPEVNYCLPTNPVGPSASIEDVISEIDLAMDEIDTKGDSAQVAGGTEETITTGLAGDGQNQASEQYTSDALESSGSKFSAEEELYTDKSPPFFTILHDNYAETQPTALQYHENNLPVDSLFQIKDASFEEAPVVELNQNQTSIQPLMDEITDGASRVESAISQFSATESSLENLHSQNVNPLVGSHSLVLQETATTTNVGPPSAPPFFDPTSFSGSTIWPLGQLAKEPPTTPAPTNTFRMGRQKPVYAKYPGLTPSSENLFTPEPQQLTTPMPMPLPPMRSEDGELMRTIFQPPPASVPEPSAPWVDFVTPPPPQPYVPQPLSVSLPREVPYKSVSYHWFYRKDRELWKPFSHIDSKNLEDGFASGSKNLVSVDGGRQDVDLEKRLKQPVYWEDTEPTYVQRCSWFYKGPMDSQFIPYTESFSAKLEEEYATAYRTNNWQRRLEFGGGEAVVLQGPNSFVHFCQQASADEWGSVPESQLRPRVVKRSAEGLQIPPAEPSEIEYLVFLVHGIGSFCDFKFRTVVETVDDFRQISNQLLHSHFKDVSGRVEFLPVQWHKALHGDGGIDEKLKPLTLKSIPKLRHFTNDTLLDILFYTSPVYCQTIMDTVGNEMNRMYNLFLDRNPTFNSFSVAVAGHSLGSLILFDLLTHQPELILPTPSTNESGAQENSTVAPELNASGGHHNRLISYRMGSAGTGQPSITYPVLDFQPSAFFAMGSPIAMFVAVRGLDSLGLDFHLPTCPAFFNIFHPYDPVAYRIESLIDPSLDLRPVLIPHHKGRKRFHLELKETMARVGTDLKNRVLESLRVTYKAVTHLAGMAEVEQEVDSAIASELHAGQSGLEERSEDEERKTRVGCLNGGRRIDYVLQEAPHQILNEYLFALSSHVCYWESEDTVLLVLNEILNEGRSTPSTPEPSSPVGIPPVQPFEFPSPSIPSTHENSILTSLSSDMQGQGIPLPPQQSEVLATPVLLHSGNQQTTCVPPPPTPGGFYTTGKRPLVNPVTMLQSQPLGMDPTAPVSNTGTLLPPPPKSGFQPRN